jgi:hypothetical protein
MCDFCFVLKFDQTLDTTLFYTTKNQIINEKEIRKNNCLKEVCFIIDVSVI